MRTLTSIDFWRRWSVTALGTLLSGLIISTIIITRIEWTIVHYLQFAPPTLFALGLTAYGNWLVQSELPTERISRIAMWCLAGSVVIGSFTMWEMYIHLLEGEPFIATLHEILLGGTEGAIVGGGIGYYEVQRQEQLRETEQVQQAIPASIDGIAILDEDERYIEVNQAHVDIYGYEDPKDFIGESWRMCYTDAELETIEEDIYPELLEEGHWRGELTGLRRNGDTYPQELSLTVMDNGGLVCVVRDITQQTERKHQIASLGEASRQLTYASTPEEVASMTVEIASDVLDKPLSTMCFHDEETDQLVPAATTESTQELLDTADVSELPSIGEEQLGMDVFRDGEMTVIEDYDTVENPAFPNLPLGTVIIIPLGDHGILELGAESIDEIADTDRHQIDILALNARAALDRAQREQALARRKEMIESLHGVTRDMVGVADVEEICELAVDAAQRILDIPNTAIWISDDTEQRLEPVTHSAESEALVGELPVYTSDGDSLSWQAFENGETGVHHDLRAETGVSNPETPMQSEIIVPLDDYGVMNFGSQTSHTFDDTSIRAAELLGASTVTALERAEREQKLETQLNRMEFFNSILRHDVLNAMTVIRGRAEFLTDELNGDQLRDAETILDWSDSILEIVQRVRTTLSTLIGESDIQLEPTDASETLREEIGRVRETYPEVTFETTILNSVRVQGNELLSEVFGNIITNAVNHNETDGLRISITATEGEENKTAIVRIADNGKGVSDESKESIFRRDKTGHAKSSGSGFGLFFVDTMVDSYGGDVRVEDNEAGGATFVIELPLAEATASA